MHEAWLEVLHEGELVARAQRSALTEHIDSLSSLRKIQRDRVLCKIVLNVLLDLRKRAKEISKERWEERKKTGEKLKVVLKHMQSESESAAK